MTIGDKVSEKAIGILDLGRMHERETICIFLTKCAKDLNFGKDSPNEVILELVKIIKEQK